MSFMKLWRQFYSEAFQNNFLVLLSPLFLILLILHYELLSIPPQSLLLLLELHHLIIGCFQSREWRWQAHICVVYMRYAVLFPRRRQGAWTESLWMVISPSVLLCATQAWYPSGQGATRLRKPECLGASQDRQKWGWVFFILTSTRILLIYPGGRLPTEGAHEATLAWWPMEFSGSWGTTAGERLVNWEVRTPTVGASRLLPVWVLSVCQGTCGQTEAIPERTTHKCVLLGQGTKGLYRQSKKTKWEDLTGRAAQSDWGWATSLWLSWCPDCTHPPQELCLTMKPSFDFSFQPLTSSPFQC